MSLKSHSIPKLSFPASFQWLTAQKYTMPRSIRADYQCSYDFDMNSSADLLSLAHLKATLGAPYEYFQSLPAEIVEKELKR